MSGYNPSTQTKLLERIANAVERLAAPPVVCTLDPARDAEALAAIRRGPRKLDATDFASITFGWPLDADGAADVDQGVAVNLWTDAGKYAGGITITHEGALELAEALLTMLECEGYGRESV